MTVVKVSSPKAFVVSRNLHTAGTLLATRAAGIERHYRQLLRTRVQDRASGSPGPQVRTGEYRNSIKIRGPFVGTDAPQAKRLEFGFVGPDSSGRHFHRRPLPHFGPAVDEIRPLFFRAQERMVAEKVNVL